MNIKEKIGSLCPDVQFLDNEVLSILVPCKMWHDFAIVLRDELHFNLLTAVVGMDWKESLGCVYYLTNTDSWEMISVKVETADLKNPMLYSVSDVWHVANFQEREVYDFFGIKFIGHPDMRRFFLRNDWVGYPLRKDYDSNPDINPIRLNDEVNEDDSFVVEEDESGKINIVNKKVFSEDEYVINIGPQHRFHAWCNAFSYVSQWGNCEKSGCGFRLYSSWSGKIV